jgi:hypothetical protein
MANKASAVHEMLLKYPTISLDVLIELGLSKTRTQGEEKKLRELASILNVNFKSLTTDRRFH